MKRYSTQRMLAVFIKEFQQMRRDSLSFAMAAGIPILLLVLFGYAINIDPKSLPTAVVSTDPGPMSRGFLAALQNTGYYRLTHTLTSEREAEALLEAGRVQFMVVIPSDFSHRLLRGERPALLVSADATNPGVTGNAIAAIASLVPAAIAHDVPGALHHLDIGSPAFEVRVHHRYNPEELSRYSSVPGLVGTILTMTMVMLTSLAMTREHERGNMENLLATPVRPGEVMVGKILPYVLIGYLQLAMILLAAFALFTVPMLGSFGLLLVMNGVFIIANLGVGFTFSTLAKSQLQAMQMTFFFFLPSILLSGFMFPFSAMPQWAQWLGDMLPLTHFLRIVRGIMLKGNTGVQLWPELWPMLLFLLIAGAVALKRYRQTLD